MSDLRGRAKLGFALANAERQVREEGSYEPPKRQ